MTCPDFTLAKTGRRGIGVIQAYSGLDYPLIAPSADVQYLIADFYLTVEADALPAFPLRIKHLYNLGCIENTPAADFPAATNTAGIVVVDANDAVVFDSIAAPADYTTKSWGSDYQIHEWITGGTVCRMLVYQTWPAEDDDKRNYNKYLTPQNATLDARSIYVMPKRVKTLCVRNRNVRSAPTPGAFIFRNNYNTTLSAGAATTTAFSALTPITINAAAGSGAGKYPCLDYIPADHKVINKINGVSGINGDFLLSANDCLWARRATTYLNGVVTPQANAQLQFGADCKPCCACSDFVTTATYMNYVRDRYKLIGTRAEEVRARHEDNIRRWNDYRLCSLQTPLRLIFVPQRCPYMDVVLMLCNPCQSCLPASELTLTINFFGDVIPAGESVTADVVCGHTAMYSANSNGLATSIVANGLSYSTAFPQIQPGDSAYVKFRLKFSLKAAYNIRGHLTGTLISTGMPITTDCEQTAASPAQAETTQMLYCDDVGHTEMPC